MVFQLKEAIGTDFIEHKEAELCKRAYKAWEKNSNILLLGSKDVLRVPILSFLVINPESGKFLHHNFVSMLLNDMYGIQTRGGCACAGPYAQDLLQMDEEMAQRFITFLEHSDSDGQKKEPQEVMKPGFARLNLPYFYDDDTIDFVLEAVNQVASKGWRIMPLYQFDSKTGTWKHRLHQYNMQSLYDIEYVMAGLKVHKTPNSSRGSPMRATKEHYKEILKKADKLYSNATRLCGVIRCETDPDVQLGAGEKHLVWFLEPKLAKKLLMKMDKDLHVKTVDAMAENLPFFPKSYSMDNLLDIDSGSVESLDEASGTDSGVESNDFTDDDVIGSPLKYGSLSRSGKPVTDKKAKRLLPPMSNLPPQNRVHYARKLPTYTAESSGAGYLSRHLLNRAKFHGSYGDLSRTGHPGMYHSNESVHMLGGATKHPSSNGKAVKLPALKGSKEKVDKVKKDKKRPMPMTTRDLAYEAYRTQWLVLNQKQ
ncbi:uncharacterized protein LOC106164153 [Lingula anatina]|uniref:Uncharacterized protein LOC106164153 n=1 Tax=Lingula anatina TaxID=7574 RepID=A0A1S3IGR8_LINAN|nr:uncharacterized protein LOC106164153 [Lingula anatina]|eukprot:XP_013397412.1 uncharacterized protein LOC106164153 [Lingula anatina]